jgi:acetyl esterase
MDPLEFRRQLNAEILQLEADIEPVGDVQDVRVEYQGEPLSLRIYTPQGEGPSPLLVYVHGAGWVAGNVDTHDNVCRRLTAGIPALVVSVDYRLAPEFKFPTALEDTYRALCWAVENTASLGGMVGYLAVAGDSAGGNLGAAVCLMARDRGDPQISFQLLVNPALDLSGYDGQAFEEMRWFREQYLGDGADMCHPYASPLLAPDLSELPPAFIITGELDCLCAEGEAYARRLREAGVPANVCRQAGTGHLGRHFARATVEAAEAVDLSVAVLRAALRPRQAT